LMTVIDRSLHGVSLINVRVDVSRAGNFGGTHYLDCTINVDPTLVKDQVILITRYEQNDDTMKAFFGNNSIIPMDFDKVRQFAGAVVLYNSSNGINRNIAVDNSFTEGSRQLRVKAQCSDGQFKMFLFYCTDITRSLVPSLVKSTFNTKIQSNRKKTLDLETQITSALNEIEKLKANDTAKRSRQTELRTLMTELNIQITNYTNSLNSNTNSFNVELSNQHKYLGSIKSHELYTTGSRIQRIFNLNKLKSSINDQILAIDKFTNDETLKIKTSRENFATLSKKEADKS